MKKTIVTPVTTVEAPVVRTSGFFKIKKGLGRQAHGIFEIVAGLGDEIQGTLQLPLDTFNAVNNKIESVKTIKKDLTAAVDAEVAKTTTAIKKQLKKAEAQRKVVESIVA